jgi:hypothetical protein
MRWTVFQGQTPELWIGLWDGPFVEDEWGVRPSGNFIGTVAGTADMISGFDPNQLGWQTLTVTYQGITATTEIYVYPPIPGESWEFEGLGWITGEGQFIHVDRSFILQGDSIDSLHLMMSFMYYDTSHHGPWGVGIPVSETTEGMTITGIDTTLVGQQDMTITFGGVTETIRIVVVENPNFDPGGNGNGDNGNGDNGNGDNGNGDNGNGDNGNGDNGNGDNGNGDNGNGDNGNGDNGNGDNGNGDNGNGDNGNGDDNGDDDNGDTGADDSGTPATPTAPKTGDNVSALGLFTPIVGILFSINLAILVLHERKNLFKIVRNRDKER